MANRLRLLSKEPRLLATLESMEGSVSRLALAGKRPTLPEL